MIIKHTLASILIATTAYSDPISDVAVLSHNGTELQTIIIGVGGGATSSSPISFFDARYNNLFNFSGGVSYWLESGSALAGTKVPLSSYSDAFGIMRRPNGKLGLGFISDGNNPLGYSYWKVAGPHDFMTEPSGTYVFSGRFLSQAAISAGYSLTFKSDSVPDSGSSLILLGAGLGALVITLALRSLFP